MRHTFLQKVDLYTHTAVTMTGYSAADRDSDDAEHFLLALSELPDSDSLYQTDAIISEAELNQSISESLNNVSDHLVESPWMLGANNSNYSVFSFTTPLDKLNVRIIFWILYVIIATCCVLGNSLVLFVIIRHRKMRNITNFFLANLAVSDLCVGVFCVIPTLLNFLYPGSWYLGTMMCKLNHFVQSISSTASILILTVISMERYFAIIHPMFSKRMSRIGLLRVVVAVIWLIAILYGIPLLMQFTTATIIGQTFCFSKAALIDAKLLVIINFVLLYVFPLGFMCVMYARISVVLWRTSTMSAGTAGGRALPRRQHRTSTDLYGEGDVTELSSLRDDTAISPPQSPINKNCDAPKSNCDSPKSGITLESDSAICTKHTTCVPPKSISTVCSNGKRWMFKRKSAEVSIEMKQSLVTGSPVTSVTHCCHKTAMSRDDSGSRGGKMTRGHRPRVFKLLDKLRDKQSKHMVHNALLARRRVIRLLIAIVVTFAVCVLPHHIRLIYQTFWEASYALLPPITLLILFTNSALNPLLYAFLSGNFRKSLLDTCDCKIISMVAKRDIVGSNSRSLHTVI